ncbi:hypothetical protein TIFTF001_001132 [Ficus carica]|uniref:Protein kinase domain-containing protein n=1 Tax=Ficus carica TaxID=3494 RepID=A0AA87ZE93_FICCA|nr:hypothetical protein TIFTF001_001132 [Ficus carica]
MMSCFPCFTSQRSKKSSTLKNANGPGVHNRASKPSAKEKGNKGEDKHINAQIFTFRELATATKNFRQECLLGEGGFGRVYKGTIKATGKLVAIKQLDRNNLHDNKEFLAEVLALSLLHHPNLVNLIGYCADGDQRLLVFEYMPGDIGPEKTPLDWFTRIKIAFGIATGLEYLHETANPPVIYSDLKSANVLLDDDLNPKLSDFGVAKDGQDGDKTHVSSRVMRTYGYSAPEYTRAGQLTLKSDIYSYGVVLLELITGRRAIDTQRPNDEQNLVSWAQPFFRDPKRFPDLADPLLNGQFPEKDLNQIVAIAAMCLQDEPSARPLISDVVTTLSFLSTTPSECIPASLPAPTPQDGENSDGKSSKHENADSEEDQDSEGSGDEESSESEDSESSDYEDVNSRDECHGSSVVTAAKEWQSIRKSRMAGSEEDDESVSSSQKSSSSRSYNGSVCSSQSRSSNSKTSSVSSRNSSIGSNRPRSSKKSGRGSVSLERDESLSRRSSTKGSRNGSFSLSRRISRASRSGNLGLSRNSSISVCLDHSYSIGSQDGFLSLHNISSRESLDGSVHYS